MADQLRETAAALREYALSLPGAVEEFPWGERVAKVNKKIFAYLGRDENIDTGLSVGMKLPVSGQDVLSLPFTEPMAYGLGKSGWVTVHLQPDDTPPVELLKSWIEESYRAVASKKLVAQLDSRGAP